MDDAGARELVARIETLLDGADAAATELVAAVLDLYGEGLARVVASAPDPVALADDELVAHLLLLHGLHPVPVAERVRGALEEVRPYLDSHGGDVELLGVEEGIAYLRLQGSCKGCPSSSATLKLAIEEAIQQAAPDVVRIEADGAVEAPPVAAPRRAWTPAGDLPDLAPGEMAVHDVTGESLLFVKLDRRLYAYRPACPACGESLADGVLIGTALDCGACGSGYDVRRAGRGVDRNLDPVPLLTDGDGRVKVALDGARTAA